ncbi:MAG: precorrin-6y C5,15-methyltransferase (decarboxylating) subunit CbiE [Candidatus Anammoxibacter sp.]
MITIVGCGPGHKGYITQIGIEKIEDADVLVGSKRLLGIFSEIKAERMLLGKDYQSLSDKINGLKKSNVAILVSGDPGFFSLAKILIKRFGIENCEVIPGISSVQLAFARIGENWNDARFVSLHGRDEELDDLIQTIKQNDKVAVLTDDVNNPSKIAKLLVDNKITDRKAYIFENLTLENERIHKLDIKSMCDVDVNGMNVVVFTK